MKQNLLFMVFICLGSALLFTGDIDPPAGPTDPASAMYTISDIYNYLITGVAGTKRAGDFIEPTAGPGAVGRTLDEVHEQISERCITCEGTLNGTRWCDNLDGTVTDLTTGLVWLQKADWGGTKPWRHFDVPATREGDWDPATWDDAAARAGVLYAGTSGAGLSDGSAWGSWRLPTKTELEWLASGPEPVRFTTQRAFVDVIALPYWSSTSVGEAARYVYFLDNGDVMFLSSSKWNELYVWPVRGGQ